MRSRFCGTHNVYADPSLLDVAGALEALPDLALKSSHLFQHA
jgi:hypothetical protein